LCHANGALLIFDEVVTGFRFDIGGGQKFLGLTPDLAAFGKAAANGMPLSFVTGRKEIMDAVDEDVFLFTTFGGERLSLAAGIAVIKELRDKAVNDRIRAIGGRLKSETNEMAQRLGVNISLRGYHPRLVFSFKDSKGNHDISGENIFLQECVKRGVFIGWTVFPCYTHTDQDVDYTLNVFEEAMKAYKNHTNSLNAWKTQPNSL
ncbi:MAG: aminotransferase class III-fold pyridoxal phosphate-dependent enzyme, partial [Desulfocucumaceae bacterium]